MNKILIFLTLISLIVPFTSARTTIVSDSDDFRIDLVRFDPSPITPGSETKVYFEITNLRSEPTLNSKATLATSFPFESENKEILLPQINPGETKSVEFTFKTNKDTKPGTYKLTLTYSIPQRSKIVTNSFDVKIIASEKSLNLINFNIEPKKVKPGEEAVIKIAFENTEDSTLQDVEVKIDLTNTTLPFAPINTGTEKTIKSINPGEASEISFNIVVLPDAKSNVYRIPIEFKYHDESGNEFTKKDFLGVIVGGNPEFQIDLEETSAYQIRNPGKIVLSLSNIGPIDIKFASISILEKDNYDVISKSRVYLGNLEPDDFETAEFDIFLKDKGPIKIELNYKDSFNNDYSQIKEIDLPVYDSGTVSKYGLQPNGKSQTPLIATILIILTIGIIYGWTKTKSLSKGIEFFLANFFGYIIKILKQLSPRKIINNLKLLIEFIKKQ
ncbi:COG1361 S-layer family protein [Candidatus Woesearchaeota archaeon]|nr:COG1361 S-layer family protein [Candidatus Woesearchaeota archaeon]